MKISGNVTSRNDAKQSQNLLELSGLVWFLTAFIGQWAFVLYMIVHYGGRLLFDRAEGWGDTTVIGYMPGDHFGNVMFAIHILAGSTLTAAGLFQLIPRLRQHSIKFHRWNGRIFLIAAIIASLGGFYLIWVRQAVSALSTGISVSANGILILLFAILAWERARQKDISSHQKYALRALMTINGVWFFRVGTAAWVILHGGEQVGIGENFDGPFVFWWHWGSLIVPLLILEFYFRAKTTQNSTIRRIVAMAVFGSTLVMGIGIIGAFVALWMPYMF